ncbi:13432_t:CDS:2 [Cetraspora pellucida]|uniref:13432_t:CDS:1 n=1 Tax=Cetraspora pellucida TaxID=1433469 RepID=A0A9N9IWL1_9GLOM|nr:13432_t:CDS:2 [Cetraspora pellucida]
MLSTESVALAVVVVKSTYIRGLKFEVVIIEMLRSIGVKVIHKDKKLKAHRGHCFSSERSFFLVSGVPELA